MKLAVVRKRGVAPCAIHRDSHQFRAEVMKVFEDFVVESHLIAADRTPISWVKREHDRLTAEFAQRKPLIRCASQGEIGRFHSWRRPTQRKASGSAVRSGNKERKREVGNSVFRKPAYSFLSLDLRRPRGRRTPQESLRA